MSSTRREFAQGMGWLALGGMLGRASFAKAQAGDPHRFILIQLDGGWTSHLSTDPVLGARRTSGNFQESYNVHDVKAPAGKSKLMTGIGFQEAFPAFSAMPTAFINGMDVAITAHDAAAMYMLTGKATIGREVTEPAISSRLATIRGGIGNHVIFGGSMPIGDTAELAPPLETSGEGIGKLVSPTGNAYQQATQDAIEAALGATNEGFFKSLGPTAQASVTPFRATQADLAKLFAKFANKLDMTDALRERYDVETFREMDALAGALLVLRSDLASVVSIRLGGFDTHTNEEILQTRSQRRVATGLATLVADLRATPDPTNPQLSLADTTTILITSEFTRTPKFNATAGTDHQGTASAIVMGKGVTDDFVAGATDDEAQPLGWVSGAAVPKTAETMIDGSTLVASLLDLFGKKDVANTINSRRIDGLFKI